MVIYLVAYCDLWVWNATGHRDMSAMEVSWSRLPEEIGKRVLSFLPVPALFRCRSVCKRWNEVVRKASFLQLCDLNGRNKSHLFITHHLNLDGFSWLDMTCRMMTCFLDLEERRWYSIRADDSVLTPTHGNIPRMLAMNVGLICEMSHVSGNPQNYTFVVFDSVANTRWELPADARIHQENDVPPIVVAAVDDDEGRSFKVVLLDQTSIFMEKQSGFFLYESSSNAWRALENPPVELDLEAGVRPDDGWKNQPCFFGGVFYATFWYYNRRQGFLFWATTWRKISEILVDENSSRPVVKLSN